MKIEKNKQSIWKEVFKVVSILEVPKNIKIFNLCVLNKIKNIEIANAFDEL